MTGSQQDRFADFARAAGIGDASLGPEIAGGNSNVTRLVESEIGPLILRHPPADSISDKAAAGIGREYAALRALHGSAPVPEPVAWCDDVAVLGQPFSLARFVEGISIRDHLPPAYGASLEAVNATGHAMIDALAQVHRADPAPLIEAGFGRGDGFVARQVERWRSVRAHDRVRELPLIKEVAGWLDTNAPVPAEARIVHCDFHLDNCLSDTDRPCIRAIIDWEMATVADPRIDLGLALLFWKRDPGERLGFPWIQAFSNRPDFVSRAALAERWSKLTGIAACDLNYFIVFAGWRLASIVEGAYVLYRHGKTDSAYARALEHDVPSLLGEVAAMIEHEAA